MRTTEDPGHGTSLAALVRRHGLASYVILTYAISWLAWFPYLLSLDGTGVLPFHFPSFLGGGELVGLLPGAYLGPLSSAFVVTAVMEGKAGLRTWRSRLFRWRIAWRWYAFALIGMPALLFLGTLPLPGALHGIQLPCAGLLLTYTLMLAVQMLTTGMAEEPGWRDFALPRLQRRHGPLRGTLILAPIWVGWHIPLFFTGWADCVGGGSPRTFAMFAVVGIFLSIITWVFNHTRESLPLAILIHSSNNNFLSVACRSSSPHSA